MKKTGISSCKKWQLFLAALFTAFYARAQETINGISIINDSGSTSSFPLWLWIVIIVSVLVGVAAIVTNKQDDFRIIMKTGNSRKKTKNR
jgi:hypothetical protein